MLYFFLRLFFVFHNSLYFDRSVVFPCMFKKTSKINQILRKKFKKIKNIFLCIINIFVKKLCVGNENKESAMFRNFTFHLII